MFDDLPATLVAMPNGPCYPHRGDLIGLDGWNQLEPYFFAEGMTITSVFHVSFTNYQIRISDNCNMIVSAKEG